MTFEISTASFHSSVGVWEYQSGFTAPSALTPTLAQDALVADDDLWVRTITSGTTKLYMSPGTDILVDGILTDRQNLPSGFILTNLSITVIFSNIGGGAGGVTQLFQSTRGLTPTIVSGGSPVTRTYTPLVATLGIIQSVLFEKFGWETINAAPSTYVRINKITITGNFTLWSSQLTLNGAGDSLGNLTGDLITITDGANGLLSITSIGVSYYDNINKVVITETILAASFITHTANEITFLLPVTITPGVSYITGISSLLSTVEILFGAILIADASGIYTLTPGKKNDTLYDREEESTRNVKIPNPFVKLGFIP